MEAVSLRAAPASSQNKRRPLKSKLNEAHGQRAESSRAAPLKHRHRTRRKEDSGGDSSRRVGLLLVLAAFIALGARDETSCEQTSPPGLPRVAATNPLSQGDKRPWLNRTPAAELPSNPIVKHYKLLSTSKPTRTANTERPPAGRRKTALLRSQAAKQADELAELSGQANLQISITPRVGLIRIPVESNALLKCLVSSQADKFLKKFDIHWSRFMYDENVYEQIESLASGGGQSNGSSSGELAARGAQQDFEAPLLRSPFNRQQQLRDFQARSRQETNAISDLLIEATLAISPVKANDNASYYCTATDGLVHQNQARIDLIVLSKPVVQLERVQPARDSKSAIVYWLIVSTGNTPITKTILMVKNDTTSSRQQQQQQQKQQQQQQQQQQQEPVDLNSAPSSPPPSC